MPDAPAARTIHLHRLAPAKPAQGLPCNGCGVCCAYAPCPLAMLRYLRCNGPCPALRWQPEQQRYVCGLLAAQPEGSLRRRLVNRWIGAGIGCDAALDTEAG